MGLDWPNQNQYDGTPGHRFSDANPTSSVYEGMGRVSDPTTNKKAIRRNLKPYKVLRKKKLHKNLKKLKTWSDRRIENIAVRAVLKKHKVKRRKLNRKFNKRKYGARRIAKVKQRYKTKPKSWKPKGRAAKHVQKVMQNRRIMKTNIWKGKGYDIRKGYR